MTTHHMDRQHPIDSGFDRHSTAADVLAGIDLSGQTALVTGGYSGLGLEITRALTGAGATVVVPARRPAIAASELHDLIATGAVEIISMDLADLDSIRGATDHLIDRHLEFDIVINNAGVMATPEARMGPGWESQFAVNHLGHFALVTALMPQLSSRGSRVVSVASAGHFLSDIRWDDLSFTRGYDRWQAYGQSKTANALFAQHLNTLGTDHGIQAFSVHPGSILTPLQRHIPAAEQAELGWVTPDGKPAAGFKTPAQGAATAAWAATSPALADLGGEYLQDCNIAGPATTDDMAIGGVKPWAIDPEAATRLWKVSSELVNGSSSRA